MSGMPRALLFSLARQLALLLPLLAPAAGHAYMSWPASRNFDKCDFFTPHGVNEHCASCNEADTCGRVGALDFAAVTHAVTDTYRAGGILEVETIVTAHHKGYMELRLCERPTGLTQDCFNSHPLLRDIQTQVGDPAPVDEAHPERWYIPPPGANWLQDMVPPVTNACGRSKVGTRYQWRVRVPADVECEHCTLQWFWVTANSCQPPGVANYFQAAPTAAWIAEHHGGSVDAWYQAKLGDCPANVGDPSTNGNGAEKFWNCGDIRVLQCAGDDCPAAPNVSATSTASPTVGTSTTGMLTTTVSTTPVSTTIGGGICIGEPCNSQVHCRSKWGWCGVTADHCNDESLWCGSDAAGCRCGSPAAPNVSATSTASSTVGTTTTGMLTTTVSTTIGGGICIGEPCNSQVHCRSKWGWCGVTADHCNDESLWCGSDAAGCRCGSEQSTSSTVACRVVPGNVAGVTDCSKCDSGYKWWPCNSPSLCECTGQGQVQTQAMMTLPNTTDNGTMTTTVPDTSGGNETETTGTPNVMTGALPDNTLSSAAGNGWHPRWYSLLIIPVWAAVRK